MLISSCWCVYTGTAMCKGPKKNVTYDFELDPPSELYLTLNNLQRLIYHKNQPTNQAVQHPYPILKFKMLSLLYSLIVKRSNLILAEGNGYFTLAFFKNQFIESYTDYNIFQENYFLPFLLLLICAFAPSGDLFYN